MAARSFLHTLLQDELTDLAECADYRGPEPEITDKDIGGWSSSLLE
jgi:hypothetical protein